MVGCREKRERIEPLLFSLRFSLFQDGADRPAWQCQACGRVSAEEGPCPLDGTRMDRRDNGLDLAVHQTLAHGGTVWAVDFAQAPQPIDGVYPYLLAVRDLASSKQLLWLPVEHADSECLHQRCNTAGKARTRIRHLWRSIRDWLHPWRGDWRMARRNQRSLAVLGSWRVQSAQCSVMDFSCCRNRCSVERL